MRMKPLSRHLKSLCRQLGPEYRVTVIDLEYVINRDFGNGYDIEISGVNTSKADAQGTHEPIIDIDTWNAVQKEFTRRAEKHAHRGVKQKSYPFTGIITCGCCGKHYHRKVTHAGVVWICDTYNHFGKDVCPSKAVPEPVLEKLAEDIAPGGITAVRAENGNRLVITTADGSEIVKRWQDRSRSESWTPKMKEAARQKALARSKA